MKRVFSFAAIAATLSVGCIGGQAKVWSQDQAGGVLALEGDENKAMQDAQNKMAQHCGPGNFQIVKRETIKVGQEQYADSATNYDETTDRARDEDTVAVAGANTTTTSDTTSEQDAFGSDTMHDSSTTTTAAGASSTSEDELTQTQGGSQTSSVKGVRDVNSVRIHYQCGGGVAAPAPAAPVPAAAAPPAPAAPAAPAPPPPQ